MEEKEHKVENRLQVAFGIVATPTDFEVVQFWSCI